MISPHKCMASPWQIGGQPLAWADRAALLRLPWPRDGKPHTLSHQPVARRNRPAGLGPAQACIGTPLVELRTSGSTVHQ